VKHERFKRVQLRVERVEHLIDYLKTEEQREKARIRWGCLRPKCSPSSLHKASKLKGAGPSKRSQKPRIESIAKACLISERRVVW
jgi:hypothetical protein